MDPATAVALASLGVSLATSVPFMFGAGQPSEEEQERMLRKQLEIQDEFEQQRAARAGMGGLEGLIGGGRGGASLAELMAMNDLYGGLADVAYDIDRAERATPEYLDELQSILAGQHARIAGLQGERTLSPLEVIQMLEATGV
jgi:hypothetical protein